MRIQTTTAQAWWIALADEIRPAEGFDSATAYTAIKHLFEFPILPTGPVKKDGGMEFDNGILRSGDATIVISKIEIYNDGISVHVPSNTTNAEIVLQKTLELFYSFGVRKPQTPPLHYYVSIIVADFEHSLNSLFPTSLLEKIGKNLPVEAKAQFSGFDINADQTLVPGRWHSINPTRFAIHRRLPNIPYDVNRYFSQANMATEQHMELLGEFEKLAAKPTTAQNKAGH
jgi:hypothetical protein